MDDPAAKWQRVIGILGGLGPHAHVEFERLLLVQTEAALDRPAKDQDYPPWLLSSVPPTPDRTRAILGIGDSPLPLLERAARRLIGPDETGGPSGPGGADFVVIPCNAAHAFLPELRDRVPLPFVDMIGETVSVARGQVGGDVTLGLLATDGTLDADVYHAGAERAGGARLITPLDLPNGAHLQETLVMQPLVGPLVDGQRQGGAIKSGAYLDPERGPGLRDRLAEAVVLLRAAGADLVVLGCTEIPLSLGRAPVGDIPLLDPMAVAATVALSIATGERDLPQAS